MMQTLARLIPIFLVLVTVGCARLEPPAGTQALHLVNEATNTVQRFTNIEGLTEFAKHIPDAKAIAVMPNLIKAGFIAGGEGGSGVVLARQGSAQRGAQGGSWGYPAFYTMGAASLGFQLGIQATEAIFIIRSDAALQAILNDQGKLGADAGITVAVIGAGIEGSTTTNIGADVLAFANSKGGLYGGLTFEGALFVRREDLNQAFYGQSATPQAIITQGAFSNPAADPLRQALGD